MKVLTDVAGIAMLGTLSGGTIIVSHRNVGVESYVWVEYTRTIFNPSNYLELQTDDDVIYGLPT